ncbi:MAG: SCP2 sterol-binding domain-containing protein [Deltaproteobacteria bacterium]|nr:SCP2 sterol-binding domain-containing protein [Deltaproteobacteria bacterium]
MASTIEFFNTILPAKLAENADLAGDIAALYQFDITGAGTWTVDLTQGSGVVSEGAATDPACSITVEQEDFEGLLDNPESGMMLFTMGKLQIEGDITLALSIQKLVE